ncbi:hypothetical protein VPH49_24860 [Pseudomonas luteola]|uniref:Lar family restriction alleviation protein n=1 Tax=Pseudomonas luteola TaxID=47886 RepID=UPI003A8C082D
MIEKLKPCPFCGSDAEAGDGFLPLEGIVYVWCKNHECLMSNGVDIGFGVDEWNRRHEDKRVAELEAELAEAVELLRKVTNQPFVNTKLVKGIEAFLTRPGEPS